MCSKELLGSSELLSSGRSGRPACTPPLRGSCNGFAVVSEDVWLQGTAGWGGGLMAVKSPL